MESIVRQQANDRARQRVGEQLRQKDVDTARAQLEDLKGKLQRFAEAEKDKIRRDPQFRDEFNLMCQSIGVDPLQSRNGLWSRLGFGSFRQELAVKTIDHCVRLRREHGTLIPMEAVLAAVTRSYGADPPTIRAKDIEDALATIAKISGGYEAFELGRRKFVKTVVLDAAQDGDALLKLADASGFFVDDPAATGMTTARFEAAVRPLLNDGLVWIDRPPGGGPVRYWVVALCQSLT
jgi:ESCRT-II complex subunit VPS22